MGQPYFYMDGDDLVLKVFEADSVDKKNVENRACYKPTIAGAAAASKPRGINYD
jgi:hypothetical protein